MVSLETLRFILEQEQYKNLIRAVEVHPGALHSLLEPWRFSLEHYMLSLETLRFILEQYTLSLEQWRFALEHCMLSWSHGGPTWTLYALTGDIELRFGAIHTLIKAVEVHPGALDALVGEMELTMEP
jgi:hypothetical protein